MIKRKHSVLPTNKYFCLLSTLLLYRSNVQGFVPPHPDSDLAETWEPVDVTRRRLKQSYNYSPNFIHPELCRHMSEEECQDVDESLQDHARRQRRIFQQQQGVTEPNDDFDDHIQDGDFSSLLNQLDYPTKESISTSSSKQNPAKSQTRPLLRRNPSSVEPDQPMIEVLVLLMRFQDHQNRVLPRKSAYEALWNERIHNWFDLNSYGNYRYHATVTDWLDTDDSEEAYAAGVSGLRYSLQESIWPLLDQLNEDTNFDWSKFDRDGDGKLDAVVILHSGYPAEVGGKDCSNQRPATDRIWSHAFASSETWTTIGVMGSQDYSQNLQQYQQLQQQLHTLLQQEQQHNGVGPQGLAPLTGNVNGPLEPIYSLHGYLIASGLSATCGANIAKMGVMVHEYMHTLGLDDVYDYGTGSSGKGIGIWDIMGYPYGPANDENYPGHLSAYSKLSLGWLTPVEWTPRNGTMDLSLAPAEISNQAIKIFLSNGTRQFDVGQPQAIPALGAPSSKMMPQYQEEDGSYEEYLLLEHRQALEYDRDLNDRTGLIIYHVDESVPRMNNRGYPGQDGWPQNGKHYRCAVLGADSLYHLERGINKGDRGDVWRPGTMLGPGSNLKDNLRRGFGGGGGGGGSAVTYPNTDAYQYGIIKETGIYVKPLSQTKRLVTVRLSWRDVLSDNEVGRQSEDVEPESMWARTGRDSDCINLWSWVDLKVEDEHGDKVKKSVHCNDVAMEPDSYCSLHDISCDLKVSEICRRECKDSHCNV